MDSFDDKFIRVLTVTDLHQSRLLLRKLVDAVSEHQPDCVAVIGDVLNFGTSAGEFFTPAECAKIFGTMPIREIVFARGNHDDAGWTEFVAHWPHARRKLIGLYGSSYAVGQLQIVGFPCMTGSEFSWCSHLAVHTNEMSLSPTVCRLELTPDCETWLPALMQKMGPPGRALWLMHEPPTSWPLASSDASNPEWARAIARYQPQITVSGHDHQTPMQSRRWYTLIGNTVCINAGQSDDRLHYCVLDFEFTDDKPSRLLKVSVQAFPWSQSKSF